MGGECTDACLVTGEHGSARFHEGNDDRVDS